MMQQPFKRAKAMFAAIAAAMTLAPMARLDALNAISPYESRGKSGKKPHHSSKRYVAQDKREARKARNS